MYLYLSHLSFRKWHYESSIFSGWKRNPFPFTHSLLDIPLKSHRLSFSQNFCKENLIISEPKNCERERTLGYGLCVCVSFATSVMGEKYSVFFPLPFSLSLSCHLSIHSFILSFHSISFHLHFQAAPIHFLSLNTLGKKIKINMMWKLL